MKSFVLVHCASSHCEVLISTCVDLNFKTLKTVSERENCFKLNLFDAVHRYLTGPSTLEQFNVSLPVGRRRGLDSKSLEAVGEAADETADETVDGAEEAIQLG